MSTETSPAPGDGWRLTPVGAEQIPTHCGGLAYDEGAGHWECAACDTPVHVRDIPGWTARVNTAPAPRAGSTARG